MTRSEVRTVYRARLTSMRRTAPSTSLELPSPIAKLAQAAECL